MQTLCIIIQERASISIPFYRFGSWRFSMGSWCNAKQLYFLFFIYVIVTGWHWYSRAYCSRNFKTGQKFYVFKNYSYVFLWHFIEYVTVHSCRPIHHLRRLVRRSGSWTLRFEKFRLLLFNTLDFPTCYAYVKINYQQGLIVNSRKESLQHFKKPWAHDHEPVTGLLNAVKVSFFYPANSKCLHVDKNSQESFKFFSFSIIVMHRL